MASEIWLPSSATDTKKVRFQCRICNHKFQTFRVYEDHVVKCSRQHDAELHDYADWYTRTHQEPDPEWGAYNADLTNRGIDPDIQFSRGRKSNIRRARES